MYCNDRYHFNYSDRYCFNLIVHNKPLFLSTKVRLLKKKKKRERQKNLFYHLKFNLKILRNNKSSKQRNLINLKITSLASLIP